MKIPSLAYFPDVGARDLAAKAAIGASKEVRLVGDALLVVEGESSGEETTPFILFFGDMTDWLFFMENKAFFVGPLH